MSFELSLLLSFPREVFQIAPPIPVTPAQGAQVEVPGGRISFYFDDWDTPPDDRPAQIDCFITHFQARDVPEPVLEVLSEGHPLSCAIWNDQPPEIEALRHIIWPENPWRLAEPTPERFKAEAELEKASAAWWQEVEHACEELFEAGIVGDYFRSLGETIRTSIVTFLRILKVDYGQYLLPDRFPVTTARNIWVMPDGRSDRVGDLFLDRLLSLRNWLAPGDVSQTVAPTAWREIGSKVEAGGERPFSEILFASALGECDPDMGNPRLALIEAVAGLEVEVKKLITMRLKDYGLTRSGVDRLVRETPLVDLATGWIRRELGEQISEVPAEVWGRCAEAVHERNELIHHERARIGLDRARGHVEALAKVARLARRAREAL
jgi:hypothetical protein